MIEKFGKAIPLILMFLPLIVILLYFIIKVLIARFSKKYKRETEKIIRNREILKDATVDYARIMNSKLIKGADRTEKNVKKIQEIDKDFDFENFKEKTKKDFLKIQEALMNKDIKILQLLETEDLYDKHFKEIKHMIEKDIIHRKERIFIDNFYITNFIQTKNFDECTVIMDVFLRDYKISNKTNEVVEGLMEYPIENTYKIVLVRKRGMKTVYKDNLKAKNCPNCGAPTLVRTIGECEYCGSIIISEEHDWLIKEIESSDKKIEEMVI